MRASPTNTPPESRNVLQSAIQMEGHVALFEGVLLHVSYTCFLVPYTPEIRDKTFSQNPNVERICTRHRNPTATPNLINYNTWRAVYTLIGELIFNFSPSSEAWQSTPHLLCSCHCGRRRLRPEIVRAQHPRISQHHHTRLQSRYGNSSQRHWGRRERRLPQPGVPLVHDELWVLVGGNQQMGAVGEGGEGPERSWMVVKVEMLFWVAAVSDDVHAVLAQNRDVDGPVGGPEALG